MTGHPRAQRDRADFDIPGQAEDPGQVRGISSGRLHVSGSDFGFHKDAQRCGVVEHGARARQEYQHLRAVHSGIRPPALILREARGAPMGCNEDAMRARAPGVLEETLQRSGSDDGVSREYAEEKTRRVAECKT